MISKTRLGLAFEKAAQELGFEFVSPFVMRHPVTAKEMVVTGLLPFVGNAKGTVVGSRADPDGAFELAEALGYFTSGLSPDYENYDAQEFREALRDWGWHGPLEKRPKVFDDIE